MIVTTSLDLDSLVASLNMTEVDWLARRVRQAQRDLTVAEYQTGKYPGVLPDETKLFQSAVKLTAVAKYRYRCQKTVVDSLSDQQIMDIIEYVINQPAQETAA